MALSQWLLGRSMAKRLRVAISDYVTTIPELAFVGSSSTSRDGQSVLAWSGSPGGRSKAGRVLLLRRKILAVELSLREPDCGAVADDGTFVIAYGASSAALTQNVAVYRVDGTRVLDRSFTALVFNTAIASDGRVAVCQTCNSNSDDSSVLTLFDNRRGIMQARWQPISGWAKSYVFNLNAGRLGLEYGKLGLFDYALDGTFVDQAAWERACIERGDYATCVHCADSLMKCQEAPSEETIRRILSALDRVGRELRDNQGGWDAVAFKVRGQCLELLLKPKEALRAYDRALSLNPQIGVKRRAEQLRKFV